MEADMDAGLKPLELLQKRMQAVIPAPQTFQLDPDMYVISTYPKAGTTWLQQIVHQLCTGGDELFHDINDVIPWLEFVNSTSVVSELPYRPKVFKTHLSYEDFVPFGGKHIYSMRNPEDSLWSHFHFVSELCGVTGKNQPNYCLYAWHGQNQVHLGLSVSDFYFGVEKSRLRSINYWLHIASWWPHHNEKEMLFLHYEDLKENVELCIGKIAQFLNISTSAQLLELVKQRSSLAYMSSHRQKFLAPPAVLEGDDPTLIPPVSTVRDSGGQNEEGARILPVEVKEDMAKTWQEVVFPVTGCKNYDELRAITSLLKNETR